MPRANLAQPSKTETRLKFNHTPGEAVGRAAETARVSDVGRVVAGIKGVRLRMLKILKKFARIASFDASPRNPIWVV